MMHWSKKTDLELLNAVCTKIKALSPIITCDERARKISCNTPHGRPKKFLEILCGEALTIRFYSQKEKVRIYPDGALEIKVNRKIETYKKLSPKDHFAEALQLIEKTFRMSQEI
jgi:hypothetical protein